MLTTPQDTMLQEASFQPEDAYCGDPGCKGFSSVEDLMECDCGNQVCQDCRKVCDCCGEEIGCVNCFNKTSESNVDLVCDNCLTKCEQCGYAAGYKRFEDDKCPHCGTEIEK